MNESVEMRKDLKQLIPVFLLSLAAFWLIRPPMLALTIYLAIGFLLAANFMLEDYKFGF